MDGRGRSRNVEGRSRDDAGKAESLLSEKRAESALKGANRCKKGQSCTAHASTVRKKHETGAPPPGTEAAPPNQDLQQPIGGSTTRSRGLPRPPRDVQACLAPFPSQPLRTCTGLVQSLSQNVPVSASPALVPLRSMWWGLGGWCCGTTGSPVNGRLGPTPPTQTHHVNQKPLPAELATGHGNRPHANTREKPCPWPLTPSLPACTSWRERWGDIEAWGTHGQC